MSSEEQLKTILRKHNTEFCTCGNEIGFGDIAWNEANTEAGTPCTYIIIQCVNCQTEIAWVNSWYPTADYPEELLNILERDWKLKSA